MLPKIGNSVLRGIRPPLESEIEDRIAQRLLDRSRVVTQFPPRFFAADVHSVPGHFHSLERDYRLPSKDGPQDQIVHRACKPGHQPGYAHSRGAPPGNVSQRIEYFLEAPVLSTQDIPLCNSPLLLRQQMAAGDVFHTDNVESRVDVRRHPAPDEIEDDFAGWGRLQISGADGGGGVYDNHGETRGGEFHGNLL